MKVGEAVEVNIGQAVVQQGKIVEIDTESSTATIVIPATKVVMSFKTQLDTTATAENTGNEHVILGVESRDEGISTPVQEAVPVAQPVETPAVESTDEAAPVEEKTDEPT